jgi:MoaA/NifB/PqqE/SkfB family radical SAM enzyme
LPKAEALATAQQLSNQMEADITAYSRLDDEGLRRALNVDLTAYPSVTQRQLYEPLLSETDRLLVWPVAKAFTSRWLGLKRQPVMMTHIVTTRCNYSCGFCCYADSLNNKTNELSAEELRKVYATTGGALNTLVFSGGETTLHKELPEIIEAAYELTPVQSVYIISNAWKPELLMQITHRIMQTCPGLHLTWSLSIEGPKAHNNSVRYTQRQGWDAWQNTIDTLFGLKAMRERFNYSHLDVQLCTVCTPDNEAILPVWYRYVRDVLRPDKWNLNLMRKSVQMSDIPLEDFSQRRQQSTTLEPFEQRYLEVTKQVQHDVLSGKLRFLYHTQSAMDGAMKSAVDLLSHQANRDTVLQNKPSFTCQAGSYGAFLGADGVIGGCEEFALNPTDNKALGNVRDVGYDFQALWQSDKAKQLRACAGKSTECNGCTLESQRNYPSILVCLKPLIQAGKLGAAILNS